MLTCCRLLQNGRLLFGGGLRAGSEADQPGRGADPSGEGSGTTYTRLWAICWASDLPRGVVALRERGR